MCTRQSTLDFHKRGRQEKAQKRKGLGTTESGVQRMSKQQQQEESHKSRQGHNENYIQQTKSKNKTALGWQRQEMAFCCAPFASISAPLAECFTAQAMFHELRTALAIHSMMMHEQPRLPCPICAWKHRVLPWPDDEEDGSPQGHSAEELNHPLRGALLNENTT